VLFMTGVIDFNGDGGGGASVDVNVEAPKVDAPKVDAPSAPAPAN
jgi:hypothetical protein